MKRNISVRRKVRTAVRYIITFVLMICMMCSLSLGVAKYSMLSTRAVLHTCDRVEYYDGLATELEHESYRLGIPYGISKKMVKGVFDKKELRRNIEKVIESEKKDQTPSIDTYNIRQNIKKNVEKEKGKLSKKQKESLDTYISQVENMYHKKVYIPGVDTIAVTLANCCRPIPGDPIIGYISKGQGVKVHRADCPNILNEKKRLIPVQWEEGLDEKQYEVNLVVHSDDRNYLLSDIVTTLQQCNVYLKHVDSAVDEGNLEATTKLTVAVKNAAHLQNLIANLKKVRSVNEVVRTIQ